MTPMRASVALTAWPAIISTGLFVLITHYVEIAAGAPLSFLVLDTSLALLFLVAGAVAWQRRPSSRTGPLLVLSAALWTLGSYGPTGIEPVWAIGFAFEGYYDVALALLALTFPAVALDRSGRVVMVTLLGAFLVRSAGRLFLADPPRTYPELFPDGPTNPFAIFESRAAFQFVEMTTSVVVLVAVVIVAVLAVRRLMAMHSLTRAVVGPVMVASVVAMGFAAIEAADTAWSTAFGRSLLTIPEPIRSVTDWLVPAGRAIVPLAFLLGTLNLRSTRGPLPAVAAQLALGDAPDEVDAALGAYIENRELADLLRAQLAELRASRARIVAAGDAERQRIERALHDGAQQHLTGIAIRLEEARQIDGIQPDGLVRKLEATIAELRDAINELRELARGIHPTILSEAGLEPALMTLARRSPVPVDLRVDLDGQIPTPTEVTAYYRRRRGPDERRTQRASDAGGGDRRAARRRSDRRRAGRRDRRRGSLRRLRDRRAAGSRAGPQRPVPHRQPRRTGHRARRVAAVRVIVADDSAVIREGVVRILGDGGAEVVAQARTADELLSLVDELEPDLAVVDIRMPPSDTAGLRAAVRIRDGYRGRIGVLVLSQFLEPEYAMMLLADGSGGIGYLLKDRVAAADELMDAARRVAAGGSAIDPAVVDEVVRGRTTQERLTVLTPRERDVLALLAEGRSNRSIADRLSLSVKTVEAQVATIFSKLGLEEHPDDNRRVLAVLAYLDGRGRD